MVPKPPCEASLANLEASVRELEDALGAHAADVPDGDPFGNGLSVGDLRTLADEARALTAMLRAELSRTGLVLPPTPYAGDHPPPAATLDLVTSLGVRQRVGHIDAEALRRIAKATLVSHADRCGYDAWDASGEPTKRSDP